MADTATRLSNANQRPGFGQLQSYYNQPHSVIHEATVVRIGMFENFECEVYVSIHGINELVKCEASLASGASSSTCTGSWSPYFVGDRVLVTFLYGDTSRPIILGRCYGTTGNSEYLMQDGLPIPQRGSVTLSGAVVKPSPLVLDPANVKAAGMVSINVTPMILV